MPEGNVGVTIVRGLPIQGTLEVHTFINGVELSVDLEINGFVYKSPLTINLDAGSYTVTATYEDQVESDIVSISVGETTRKTFTFMPPPLAKGQLINVYFPEEAWPSTTIEGYYSIINVGGTTGTFRGTLKKIIPIQTDPFTLEPNESKRFDVSLNMGLGDLLFTLAVERMETAWVEDEKRTITIKSVIPIPSVPSWTKYVLIGLAIISSVGVGYAILKRK